MEHLNYLKKLDNEISNNEYYDAENKRIENNYLKHKDVFTFLFLSLGILLLTISISDSVSPFLFGWGFLFLSNFILINRETLEYMNKLKRILIVGLGSLMSSFTILIFLCCLFFSFEKNAYFQIGGAFNGVSLFSFCGFVVSLCIYFYDISKSKIKKNEFIGEEEKENYKYSNKIDDKNIEEVDLMISIANVNELNHASDFLSEELEFLLEENGFNSYDEYFIKSNNDNELNIENY